MTIPDSVPTSPPGWYEDRAIGGALRWWDGHSWGPLAPAPSVAQVPQVAQGSSYSLTPGPNAAQRKPKDVSVAFLLAVGGLLIPIMMGTHRLYLGRIGSWLGMLALYGGGVLLTPVIHGFALLLLLPGFGWWLADMIRMRKIVAEVNGFRTPTLKEQLEHQNGIPPRH